MWMRWVGHAARMIEYWDKLHVLVKAVISYIEGGEFLG
jgi:hypothetical protein